MTQQMEAGASVHLPLDHLGLVVDSFGPAVVMRQRERCWDGLDVQVQAAGEGVQVRQVSFAGAGDPLLEPGLVSTAGVSISAKERIRTARVVISGQAPWRLASVSCWPAVRRPGLVSRMRAARRGDRCGRSLSRRPWLM